MNVNRAVKGFEFAAAHGFHDLVAAQHAARAFGQRHQQVELVGGQLARRARNRNRTRVAVNLKRAKMHHLVAAGRCGAAVVVAAPAQHGANAGQQLARLERLGQVVVSANFQADDAIHRVALGRQHQHGGVGRGAAQALDAAAHFQAVHVGQHQVQDHQVGRAGLQRFQAGGAGGGMGEAIARLAQILAHHAGQAGVVFDHQKLLCHGPVLKLERRSPKWDCRGGIHGALDATIALEGAVKIR